MNIFLLNNLLDNKYDFFHSFNWISWPTIYVFIVLSSSIFILSLSLFKIYQTGLTYYSTGKLIKIIFFLWRHFSIWLFIVYIIFHKGEIMFFGSSLVIYILSIHLAREWPKVMTKWELKEREMRQFGYPPNTALKFKLLTSIIMILAIST